MTPYEQGIVHYQAGDYEAGLGCFTEAINQGYQPLEATYYERSKCYEALGQMDAAKADLAHMLTLSITEARRKQVTDLIALLDQAEISGTLTDPMQRSLMGQVALINATKKPLPPPDKIPVDIKVEENEAGLTITIANSNKLTVVIGMFILYGLAWGSLWLVNYYMPCLIGMLLGLVYISYKAVLDGGISQNIITINGTSLKVSRNPPYNYTPIEVLHSSIGQIFCKRVPSTIGSSPTESYALLIGYKTGEPHGSEGLIDLGNYDQIRYVQWKLRDYLKLSHRPAPFEYLPAKIAQGYGYRLIRQWDRYDVGCALILAIIFLFPILCTISINKAPVAIVWFFVWPLLCLDDLKGVWYVQQIVDNGRITQGLVVYKNHRVSKGKNTTTNYYDVYYRYYGYEAIVNSEETFKQFHVGDTIKVGYLPSKPHISKPYY